jgi:hypothetical protein
MSGQNTPPISVVSQPPRILSAGQWFLDDYAAVLRRVVLDQLQHDAELLLARSRHEARLGNFIASRASARDAATLHPEWGPAHALHAQAAWHLALLRAEAIEASPWHTPSPQNCRDLLDEARRSYARAAHACPEDAENPAAAAWIAAVLSFTRTEAQTAGLLRKTVPHA